MDSGYYAALTGLVARSQALDTAAANLANAQTPGYRAEREYFRSVVLGPNAENSQLSQAVNDFGLLGGDHISLAQGALTQTGNPLDLAIQGQGFFQIQTSNGPRFTRDGSFHRSQTGFLVTAAEAPVLSMTGQPIAVPPGQVSIGTDGTLSVAGGTAGTVGMFTFSRDVSLTPEGADRYAAPQRAVPAVAADATMRQGALESANQDVVQGTMELILIQRQADMMQKALTIFHTDFNKFAAEDLPRVP